MKVPNPPKGWSLPLGRFRGGVNVQLIKMVNRFILNEVSYFGAGARKELPEVLNRMGVKKALVCTDKGC